MAVALETRRWGSITDPSSDELRAAARSLREDDPEHPDCWLTDLESGWTLTADQNGVLKWSRDREGVQDVHLRVVPREKVLTLWLALARRHCDCGRGAVAARFRTIAAVAAVGGVCTSWAQRWHGSAARPQARPLIWIWR